MKRVSSQPEYTSANCLRNAIFSGESFAPLRAQERFYQGNGMHAVPVVIVNDTHLIQGGQPVAVFEQALQRMAAEL